MTQPSLPEFRESALHRLRCGVDAAMDLHAVAVAAFDAQGDLHVPLGLAVGGARLIDHDRAGEGLRSGRREVGHQRVRGLSFLLRGPRPVAGEVEGHDGGVGSDAYEATGQDCDAGSADHPTSSTPAAPFLQNPQGIIRLTVSRARAIRGAPG